MAHSKLIRSTEFPYHVVNRSLDRQFYPIEMSRCWKKLMQLAHIISCCYGAKIHALVLMSNHYHLLISTPDANLDDCMQYMQREFSLWLRRSVGVQRYRFQGRYRSSIICESRHYVTVYRYVYQNPVRAGLCERVEDYPFSTLHGRMGRSKLSCPIFPSHDIVGAEIGFDLEKEVSFLNQETSSEQNLRTRRALVRRLFKPAKRLS